MANAHSHAFQRGLRGTGERPGRALGARRPVAGGGGGDFWSWRLAMYRLAESL